MRPRVSDALDAFAHALAGLGARMDAPRRSLEARLQRAVETAQLRAALEAGQVPCGSAHGHLFRAACEECGAAV